MINTEKIKNLITDNISDTLYIPLLMKKQETIKPNSFFKDELACEIIDKIEANQP